MILRPSPERPLQLQLTTRVRIPGEHDVITMISLINTDSDLCTSFIRAAPRSRTRELAVVATPDVAFERMDFSAFRPRYGEACTRDTNYPQSHSGARVLSESGSSCECHVL